MTLGIPICIGEAITISLTPWVKLLAFSIVPWKKRLERQFISFARSRLYLSSYSYAINKLESIIDILELTYNNSKPIKYDKHKLCIVDENGYVKTGYISIDDLEYDENDYITSDTPSSECQIPRKSTSNYKEHRDYVLSLDISDKEKDFKLIEKLDK